MDGKRPLPLVNLVCDQASFEAALARFTGADVDIPPDGQCRLLDGGNPSGSSEISPDGETPNQQPAGDAVLAALLGQVRRMVFGADNVIIDASRKHRFYTGAVKDAILVTHQTCAHPTCDIPAVRCDIDHITQHQHGGHTNQTNGRPFCWYHHHRARPTIDYWHDEHGPDPPFD